MSARRNAAVAGADDTPRYAFHQPSASRSSWTVTVNGQRFPIVEHNARGFPRVTNQFRSLAAEHRFSHLPSGIAHDPETNNWYVNQRPRNAPGEQAYNPSNAAAYYSKASERLAVEGKMVGPGGFVVALPVARVGQAVGDGVARYVPVPRVQEGAAGMHHSVTVNSHFDDSEGERERDPLRAMIAAAAALRAMRGDDKQWYSVGLTFVFLLAGEMKDGSRAEERADGGLYRVPTTLRAGPSSNLGALLERAATGVMQKINAGFGGGIESRFYGVSQWRLLRVDISAVPVKGGRGGLDWLLSTDLPLATLVTGITRNTMLYSPPGSRDCFRQCLAMALAKKRYKRFNRGVPLRELNAVHVPQALQYDGGEVPCASDVLEAWGEANGCTINAHRPATAEEETETGCLLVPLCLVERQHDLPEKHVDLLYFDNHWSLILEFGRAYKGLPARVHRSFCRHCLALETNDSSRRPHTCGEDSTTMALQPAQPTDRYAAKNQAFVGRLPLPVAMTLELRPGKADEDGEEGDTDCGEIAFKFDVHSNTQLKGRAEELASWPKMSEMLFDAPRKPRRGSTTFLLLQHLHYIAKQGRDGGVFQQYAEIKKDGHLQWQGEPCAACGEPLTKATAVHHHEHIWGRFVAWVCAPCNKAEAMHAVTVVTRGLKHVVRRLYASYKDLSTLRLRWHGDWKDPISLFLSWQDGEKQRRTAVRLVCIEKLADVDTGVLGRGSLRADVTWFCDLLWQGLGIEPLRFATLPQIAEAACLAPRPGVPRPRLMLPHTAQQMALCSHRAGGLVYARPGAYHASDTASVVEFDITKCFGALLQEKVAVALGDTSKAVPRTADWRGAAYADTWMSAVVYLVKNSKGATVLRDLRIPERVQQGLPVPRGVLLALEMCGAVVQPLEAWQITYEQTHTALMDDLLALHGKAKANKDTHAARLAKTMMVSAYGKLAQNDCAWPEQHMIHSRRDAQLSLRHTTPSLRVELVREATYELQDDVWEVEPNLDHYPHCYQGKRDSRRLCLEDIRAILAGSARLTVLRVFHDSYIVVEGKRSDIESWLDHHGLSPDSVTLAQREDAGLEILTLAPRRAKHAKRPVYAGQDIAMRSWEKIYRLLAAACERFGAGKVTVIRVMVDCLTLYVEHDPGVDVAAELIATGATGDGETPGSWKDEYAGDHITLWYQLNKTGYEVRFHPKDSPDKPEYKRRLGGLPKIDRDNLPHYTFPTLIDNHESLVLHTSRGPICLRPPSPC